MSEMVRGNRGPSFAKWYKPSSPTVYTCSKNMCPYWICSNASCRCSAQENRPRVRVRTKSASPPFTGRPKSRAISSTTSGRASAGSIRHGVRRTGNITARSTDVICASCRRICSYTRTDNGHRSSGVVSTDCQNPPSTNSSAAYPISRVGVCSATQTTSSQNPACISSSTSTRSSSSVCVGD